MALLSLVVALGSGFIWPIIFFDPDGNFGGRDAKDVAPT